MNWTTVVRSWRYCDNVQNFALLRHRVVFYDVDDDIYNNRNNGEKFKDSEPVRLDRYRVPEERREAEKGRRGQLHH